MLPHPACTLSVEHGHARPGVGDEQAAAGADAALAPLAIHSRVDHGYETVLTMIEDLLHDRSIVRVADLAVRHGISRRHVERLFARYVGVIPKWVICRYRIHDVIATLDEGHAGPLAELAVQFGWFDQPHFNCDFAAQVGTTPSSYRRRPSGR